MTRRMQVFAGIGLLLAVVLLWWAFMPSPVVVEWAKVERGSFTLTVDDDGITQVRDRYVLTAPVSGTLLRIGFKVGDRVVRDQTLATIVPSAAQMLDLRTRNELAARVEAAAARYARAGAAKRQADASLAQSGSDLTRLESLGKQGYVSTTELERARLSLDLRRKDRDAALFEQDAAGHDLEQARAALRESTGVGATPRTAWTVRAPIAGQILAIARDSEGPIGVGGEILTLADLTRLEARIDVLTTEATRIRPQAYVELDAGNGSQLTGRVRLIEPGAHTKVSALGVEEQRVNVVVDLLAKQDVLQRIGDGFRVDAKIEVAHEDSVLTAPVAAIFRSGADWTVFRIVKQRAQLTRVQLGARGDDRAVIRQGLDVGDRVVVYPSDSVRDGVRVDD